MRPTINIQLQATVAMWSGVVAPPENKLTDEASQTLTDEDGNVLTPEAPTDESG